MKKASKKDHRYVVYHFEMGSVNNVYSNIALTNNEVCAANFTNSENVCTRAEIIASSSDARSFDHSAEFPRQECFYDAVSTDKIKEEATENSIEQYTHLYSIPFCHRDQHFNTAVLPPRKEGEKLNCPNKQLNNTQDHVDLANAQKLPKKLGLKHVQEEKRVGKEEAEQDFPAHSKSPENHQVKGCRGCGMTFLQVVTCLVAAVVLALVMMIINGKITCSTNFPAGGSHSTIIQQLIAPTCHWWIKTVID